jgi:KaiC/GvpD/RAD55 family RecA-like ATPase
MISTGFTSLDGAIGGLAEKKDYLIYGPVGSGKSGFAMNFLHAGLVAGEIGVLVTRRSARMVLDHARTFGWDFESFLLDSRMILFEYMPKILQKTAGLGDENHIVAELYRLLEGTAAKRVVFDPLTPILEGTINTNVVFRCRSLLDQLSQLGSTNLYVMDMPESEPYLQQCRDQFHGVMRLAETSPVAQRYRLTVERIPAVPIKPVQIDFQLRYLSGVAEISAPELVTESVAARADQRCSVLTIAPVDRRPILRSLLSSNYSVIEAESAADGMAKVAASSPDLIVIDKESSENDGFELCLALRSNGLNMPIVMVAEHLRRARDRIEINAVGADACVQGPLDGRLLKLEIQNLLHRYDPNRPRREGRVPDVKLLAHLRRERPNTTVDQEYFFQRLEQEMVYSLENDLSFSVIILTPDRAAHRDLLECSSIAQSVVRSYDLIFTSGRSVAVLLAEAGESGSSAFLKNFQKLHKGEFPHVACRSYQQQSDFAEDIRLLIEEGAERTYGTSGRA